VQIVDDDNGAREDEQRVGHVQPPRRRTGQTLDETNDVIAQVSDSARPERTQLRHVRRLISVDECAQVLEGIGRLPRTVPAALERPVLDGAVSQSPRAARLGAKKRVPRPRLTTCRRRLEQKGKRTAPELGER